MSAEMQALLVTVISIAVLHTLLGPDHYLPFIALSKTRNWSLSKTLGWTLTCGIGHVLSSLLLGLAGAVLGWSFSTLGWLQNIRGGVAGWLFLLFGLLYFLWGLKRFYSNRPHKHFDLDDTGELYVYDHRHGATGEMPERFKVTPWVMFIIFVLGPCEPMIPMLYFPAAQNSWLDMITLIVVYTLCTLATMSLVVVLGYYGLSFVKTSRLEKYTHTAAGFTLFLCGAGMLWLGW
ncbi:MAG: sulfite exporter TauE/SafE family protein [Gloeobacteraceae cyanobacterium ES-bin-316]|nr:sulfite exporter TauE/SafE family protein [Ferruginibacter sp.]